jgi:hypothetical protein
MAAKHIWHKVVKELLWIPEEIFCGLFHCPKNSIHLFSYYDMGIWEHI